MWAVISKAWWILWQNTALILMLKMNICLFSINTLGLCLSQPSTHHKRGYHLKNNNQKMFMTFFYFWPFPHILRLQALNILYLKILQWFECYFIEIFSLNNIKGMPDNNIQNTALCLQYALMSHLYGLKILYQFSLLCVTFWNKFKYQLF